MINFRDEEEQYFIYAHYKADTGEPFYIGLGRKRQDKTFGLIYRRAFAVSQRTDFWKNVANKHGYTVEILLDNLTEEEAKKKETEFILLYKRRDPDGGLLVNLTDGGDGTRYYKPTPEAVDKMRLRLTKSVDDQVFKHTMFEPTTGCWVWTGLFDRKYPIICFGGRNVLAKRNIYEYYRYKIPSSKITPYNTCGLAECVNPYHMKLMTNVEAGTRNSNKGEDRYNSTLKSNEVLEIRKLFKAGMTRKELAIKFKVNKPVIRNIIAGKSWKHIILSDE